VTGDLDSLAPSQAQELRARGSAFEVFPADKDITDLDLALMSLTKEALASGSPVHVVATAVTGGRLDHTLSALGGLARSSESLDIDIVEPDLLGWVLHSRRRSRVQLAAAGATVSLIAPIAPAIVSCSGMKWPLDQHELVPLESLGVSNVVIAPYADIQVDEGVLLVLAQDVAASAGAAFGAATD
jgi:thiamine pyrophosphokinase